MLDNKNAQIGETMTWVVATIVIVVILVLSIYITSVLAVSKKVIKYKDYDRENDLILEKSLFTYFLLDSSQQEIIYDTLANQEYYVDFGDKLEEIEDNLK